MDCKSQKSHDCYNYIQGQLLLSGLQFCDFVLYTKRDIYMERVYRDSDLIKNMVNRLPVKRDTNMAA